MKNIKNIIKDLKEDNPYPEDIFTEPTSKEWKRFHKVLRNHGMIGDKFMGSAARLGWVNCLSLLEELLEDEKNAGIRVNRARRKKGN